MVEQWVSITFLLDTEDITELVSVTESWMAVMLELVVVMDMLVVLEATVSETSTHTMALVKVTAMVLPDTEATWLHSTAMVLPDLPMDPPMVLYMPMESHMLLRVRMPRKDRIMLTTTKFVVTSVTKKKKMKRMKKKPKTKDQKLKKHKRNITLQSSTDLMSFFIKDLKSSIVQTLLYTDPTL